MQNGSTAFKKQGHYSETGDLWTWTWANSGRWWGAGRPARCSPWGHKVSDTAGRRNDNKKAPFPAEPLIQGPLVSTFSPPPWGYSAGLRTCPRHHPRPRALEPIPGGSCTPEEGKRNFGVIYTKLAGGLRTQNDFIFSFLLQSQMLGYK